MKIEGKIVIKIDGEEKELTLEEATELRDMLDGFIGRINLIPSYPRVPFPVCPPVLEEPPSYPSWPQVTWC